MDAAHWWWLRRDPPPPPPKQYTIKRYINASFIHSLEKPTLKKKDLSDLHVKWLITVSSSKQSDTRLYVSHSIPVWRSDTERTTFIMTSHLWPRMSDWSQTPPKAMRWNSRPRVRAMERPTLVFPTPGGPTKQSMGPLRVLLSCRTARYSSTLLFSFSMA